MEKLKLGTSGLEVSALCLGTDIFGSKRDKATCFELLNFFHESGGTFIDTANFYASWLPGYSGGESETVIGAWLSESGARNQMVVGSKIGFPYPGSNGGLCACEIERECEKSLKRLGTDRIDVYYAHKDDRETPVEEIMEAFHRLVKSGKVRVLGASNLHAWRIAEANTIAGVRQLTPYSVVQQRYTYVRPRYGADFGPQIVINETLKDYARSSGVGLMAYSVLLSGAYTRGRAAIPPQYAGPESDQRLAALQAVAGEANVSINQAVIAWMRQSDPPILPIIAGSRVEQLAENIAALELTLTEEQMTRLNTAGDSEAPQGWLQPT